MEIYIKSQTNVMKNLKANIKELWRGSKWHTLSIFFTYPFTLLANIYNWMDFKNAMFNQIQGSQYFLQLLICFGISYIVGYLVELAQMKKGTNDTQQLWIKNARPDIWTVAILGALGCILAILTYIIIN